MEPKGSDASDGKSAANHPKEVVEGQWTTGIWDCCKEGSNACLFTCLCPCIAFGQIVEIVDRGTTPSKVACMLYIGQHFKWLYGSFYRSKLRRLFSLPESPCSDLFLHSCCCTCAILQEYRELKNRGIDPSIGWEANVEKWKRDGLTPPILVDGMSR